MPPPTKNSRTMINKYRESPSKFIVTVLGSGPTSSEGTFNAARPEVPSSIAHRFYLDLASSHALGEAEKVAIGDGVAGYENLLSKLADVPTRQGQRGTRSAQS
jgi:hypothetical protein